MPLGREVGADVGGVLINRYRLGEVHLLPARSRLASEGGAGQQLAGRGPQATDMGPGVRAGLVEPDPGDKAVGVGLELYAHIDRGRVTRIRGRRLDVGSPDRARAVHVDRDLRSRLLQIAAVIDRPRLD